MMLKFLSLYGINALSFVTNVGAIFIYSRLAGPAGYGTYGIYVALMSIFLIVEMSLLKASLAVAETARASHTEEDAQALAVQFLNWALVPILIGSVVLILAGDLLFPADPESHIGGSLIAAIAVAEHLLSYPSTRLSFHLATEKRFGAVYILRLGATLLRHGFAWSVLLVTGSIVLAIAAIIMKGAVLGIVSLVWTRRRFALAERPTGRPTMGAFIMLGTFFGAAFALLAIQELPSVYIARSLGREALGNYRFFYDLTAAIWFVATIYPTVLFAYLLPKHGRNDPKATKRRLRPLSDILVLFHLTYFATICTLLSGALLVGANMFRDQMPFAFAVAAAVSLLGYSRFLIEATQALGHGRQTFVAVLISVGAVAAFFLLAPAQMGTQGIGWGWMLGQTVLVVLLKLIMARSINAGASVLRDIAAVLFPFFGMIAAYTLLPNVYIFWLSFALMTGSGLATLTVLFGFYRAAKTSDVADAA
ncbi:hypothetical protein [Devosia psychrophila]|uniref:Membrane protein involved in the export of O-antigen and teichoic acid n=1 Tax=Devosia psychrophila TaxID=728005 RepID=A0A0F5Q1R5_9HYPH|nr:hypothetical protein [Devosia psychrophila]KKC34561.1 hypothetical protein WH91_02190 [Devosia psychrophila]SFD35254.1 Membrane protein involved in the export of O-antigen and teichoic acid [Devosia psychrophila]